MTIKLLFIVGILLFFVTGQVLSDSEPEQESQIEVPEGANRRLFVSPGACGLMCDRRCSLHSRRNVCMRACGTCCLKCRCVPPGTAGNREKCGRCYTDMRTHGNKAKCP